MSNQLWKQCANWLCQLKVLASNHRVTWPDATIFDLAYALRDGGLLCHIACSIDPDAVDMRAINQRPHLAQCLCLKNIRHFLHACTQSFGLKEIDLFKEYMLYDFTDFARVLHTLSKLSNCPKAQAKGIPGFPKNYTTLSQDEEQIYRTLEDLVNEDTYEEFYYRHHGAVSVTPTNVYGSLSCAAGSDSPEGEDGRSRSRQYYTAAEQEEVIYEDLCNFKRLNFGRMQRELNFVPKEKRDYCIKELVETEGNYVDVLNMLRQEFIKPICNMKDQDKAVVFMNIKDLGEVHGGFYQDVLECIAGKSRKRLGEIFLEYKDRFLKYGQYCSDLPKAQETLDNLIAKDESVREEVARCEQKANESKFRLRDLLAVPMQRILKYHLLLRELLSNTARTHEEYHAIQHAYDAMLDVSDYINEVKRDSEQLHIIKEIQDSITDWNMPVELKDYGRLRKDSELKVQSHDTNGKTKVRYVFVFDKVMLMCKAARGDHYSYKDSLKLSNYKVQDVSTRARIGRDTRWGFCFMLAHVENRNAYTLFAKTEEDKKKWIGAIQEALDNIFPNQATVSTHYALMYTFDKPSSCAYCKKLLKGLFYQGYRCENCGQGMHKECISLLSKCGSLAIPPALPPRPPSMLPTLNHRFSNCSLDDGLSSLQRQSSMASVASLPPITIPPPPLVIKSNGSPDYINTKIEDHPWHVGDMDRETANGRLGDYPRGAYLVRCRVQNGEKVGYALSLKTEEDVKHMKICQQEGQYFLSDNRKFPSIVELVTWYNTHSLKECFSGLDAKLGLAVGDKFLAKSQYDFVPNEKNMLALRAGQMVIILDTVGADSGWWKACDFDFNIGFIPKNFVEEENGEKQSDSEDTQKVNENNNETGSNTQDIVNNGKEEVEGQVEVEK